MRPGKMFGKRKCPICGNTNLKVIPAPLVDKLRCVPCYERNKLKQEIEQLKKQLQKLNATGSDTRK